MGSIMLPPAVIVFLGIVLVWLLDKLSPQVRRRFVQDRYVRSIIIHLTAVL